MCGILGAVTTASASLNVSEALWCAARDSMTHRGPDDAGLWWSGDRVESSAAVLAHRRLAVLDPTPAGHQPMATPDGRWILTYNGELYNDAELRQQLRLTGTRFRTSCDTETVLAAIERWGSAAVSRFRGMFALAAIDTREQTLLLARDPLGVKPLYVARAASASGDPVFVFASEPRAMFELPVVDPQPDPVTVGSFMTTIRPTLGHRTMFAGVHTLLPGEVREIDWGTPALVERSESLWDSTAPMDDASEDEIRHELQRSVAVHLRSDVRVCLLLSGGLDSAVIAREAAPSMSPLMTFCAGADGSPDLPEARSFARQLGADHREAFVTRDRFVSRWPEMIAKTGVPLSTPNEVAIDAIARTLRLAGNTVTLSGEGADELFAGYDVPMRMAQEFVSGGDADGGRFHVESNQWTPLDTLGSLFISGMIDAEACAAETLSTYRKTWKHAVAGTPDGDPLRAHRRFHRMANLPNLLRRLDSATMLSSVEGRTPFADMRVAQLAERLPSAALFDPSIDAAKRPATKLALRRAYTDDLPDSILQRPKASFPIPFESWIEPMGTMLRTSVFARDTFSPAAVEAVASRPRELWNLAWPMMNLAMWGDHWWGGGTDPDTLGSRAGACDESPKVSA